MATALDGCVYVDIDWYHARGEDHDRVHCLPGILNPTVSPAAPPPLQPCPCLGHSRMWEKVLLFYNKNEEVSLCGRERPRSATESAKCRNQNYTCLGRARKTKSRQKETRRD